MSRIAGIYHREKMCNGSATALRMLELIKSFPDWLANVDSLGYCEAGWTGFSHPKILKVRNVVVAMDGYIYNRDELGEYEDEMALFIHLYQKHGFEEMIKRLNGDFAIFLYDASSNTVWLARDRFGIKPLYFIEKPDFFAFSSRLKALLTLPGVSRQPRRDFVGRFAGSHYRYFDNEPDKSPYKDISQLPPAHILCCKNGKIALFQYWRLMNLPNWTDSKDELACRYRSLLFDSVFRRMKVAQRPAFTLSGGMDSSSVLASAVKITSRKQHAFSTIYSDKTYDESEKIKSMLDSYVEQWHPVNVDCPDVMDIVKKMISIHDEPVATATWLSHFLLCKETVRQGFGSLFGGLGGDELNAGEYEHFIFFFADLHAAGNKQRLKKEVKMWMQYHDHPLYRKSFDVVQRSFEKVIDFNQPGRCLPDRERVSCYARAVNPDYFDLQKYKPILEHPFSSYLKNRTYQDMTRETIPCCLRAEDRQAAAFGLNNFLPFFDYRLVEFMFRVPEILKYNEGVTKYLLRESMRGILPEETRIRVQKTGWNAPAHIWFSGRGQEFLRDLLASQAFKSRGIYNVKEVQRLLDEHEKIVSSGAVEENHMMFFWQLVNLELWFKILKDYARVSEV